MAEKVPITIDVTSQESQVIERLAHERGYTASSAFLLALVRRVVAAEMAQQEDYDFDTQEGVMAALRDSWHQAMSGQTRPVDELWDALDAD